MAGEWAELSKSGLPEAVREKVIAQGYDSSGVFANAFVDTSALEGWLKRVQPSLGDAVKNLSAEEWSTHPIAAKLRLLRKQCQPAGPSVPDTGGVQAQQSLRGLVGLGGIASSATKLTTTDRERMRKETEKRYPAHVFSPATLPAMSYLQVVSVQCTGKHWEWVPWNRIVNEEASQEIRAKRAEAEEADLAALTEVFNLCFDGASLDDALNHVVVERDLLRHLLMPQPKTQKQPNVSKKRNVEGVPHVPPPLLPLRDNKRGSGDTAAQAKKPRTGECHTWMDGFKCKDRL
ncbi:CELA2A, partial [Symbiodinium sp. CCMP2456]